MAERVYCGCSGRGRVRVMSDRDGAARAVVRRKARNKSVRCIVCVDGRSKGIVTVLAAQ